MELAHRGWHTEALARRGLVVGNRLQQISPACMACQPASRAAKTEGGGPLLGPPLTLLYGIRSIFVLFMSMLVGFCKSTAMPVVKKTVFSLKTLYRDVAEA